MGIASVRSPWLVHVYRGCPSTKGGTLAEPAKHLQYNEKSVLAMVLIQGFVFQEDLKDLKDLQDLKDLK